jgi:hypothetical protein
VVTHRNDGKGRIHRAIVQMPPEEGGYTVRAIDSTDGCPRETKKKKNNWMATGS